MALFVKCFKGHIFGFFNMLTKLPQSVSCVLIIVLRSYASLYIKMSKKVSNYTKKYIRQHIHNIHLHWLLLFWSMAIMHRLFIGLFTSSSRFAYCWQRYQPFLFCSLLEWKMWWEAASPFWQATATLLICKKLKTTREQQETIGLQCKT